MSICSTYNQLNFNRLLILWRETEFDTLCLTEQWSKRHIVVGKSMQKYASLLVSMVSWANERDF